MTSPVRKSAKQPPPSAPKTPPTKPQSPRTTPTIPSTGIRTSSCASACPRAYGPKHAFLLTLLGTELVQTRPTPPCLALLARPRYHPHESQHSPGNLSAPAGNRVGREPDGKPSPLLPKHHPRLPNAGSTLTHPLLPPPPPSAPSAARTGSLLMHFASNRDGKRPERMAQWQRIAASPRNEWNKALNSTRYVSEMDEFWRGLGEGEDEGCVVNDIGGRK
ncbi:glycosyltransferase family 34 protein [Bipolaris maydis]|nr:glycosyltransferase family 34 protein [Bipolaris maydis]